MRIHNIVLAIAAAALVAPAASALIDLSQLAAPAQGHTVNAAAASGSTTGDDAHPPRPDFETFKALPLDEQRAVLERHGISPERFDHLQRVFDRSR